MKTLFLDRDGVINRNPPNMGYVRKWSEFDFLPDSKKAIRILTENGYRLIVVTNQSGIGRGLYSEADLADIHARMCRAITEAGGAIQAVYYCPHHPDAGCDCRKPEPGMLVRATREHGVDLASAALIGDTLTDIGAGRRVGIPAYLVLTGLGQQSYRHAIARTPHQDEHGPEKIFTDLYTATQWLVKNDS